MIFIASIGRVRQQLSGLKSARFQVLDYYGKRRRIGLAGGFWNGRDNQLNLVSLRLQVSES